MKSFLLNRVRLSWYFLIALVVYFILLGVLPRLEFEKGALTLFSVNSFLYGFYISPILSAQKARIEDLHRIVRAESNAIFTILLASKKLTKKLRVDLRTMFSLYITQLVNNQFTNAEKSYEEIISYCINYKGKESADMDKILEKVVANQQNRTNLNMQIANRVYSNEWIIMMVLFVVTILFVMFIDTGAELFFRVITAFICAGLSMLIVILVKLSTLTHKKAKQIWNPMKTLLKTNYYRINETTSD